MTIQSRELSRCPNPSFECVSVYNMTSFTFFQHAVRLAHSYWGQWVKKGDIVVDATCGNGRDTLILAQMVLTTEKGKVIAIDLQTEAISKAQELLRTQLSPELYARIEWFHRCHSKWPEDIYQTPPRLIVYNLGYLPGGNKNFTTLMETTWKSVEQAMNIITPGGWISLTCYPGHSEGLRETRYLKKKLAMLDPSQWSVCQHEWLNRNLAPSLIIIEKSQRN